jgi:YhcH/YjgK/YiaL family protein
MIFGDLSNIELYKGNKALYEAVAFLRDKAATAADGRHDLSGGMFVTVKAYEPKPRDGRRYETHVKYADVQYVFEGDETIYVRRPEGLAEQENFLAERDIVYYDQPSDGLPEQGFVMRKGVFLLLCPEDAHKPECLTTVPNGRKAIVKIPMTLLK